MNLSSGNYLEQFLEKGYLKIENAFPRETADDCRKILWKATGVNPDDRATWKQPVIRVGEMFDKPFGDAANSPALQAAYDALVGKNNWYRRNSLGSFPIRFPIDDPAPDTGWHVDASFPGDDPKDYLSWRINIFSTGRGLLMLFLFSDVSEKDAPTRILEGSHLNVARMLAPYDARGLSFMELAGKLDSIPPHHEALATGEAGTVYLCHPFIVHAAQDHRGNEPKFMAQPPLLTKKDFSIDPVSASTPVELAIVKALEE